MTRPSSDIAASAPPSQKVSIACMLIALAVVITLGVAHVSRRHTVVRKGYELTNARSKLRKLQEDNRRLRLEKSVLTAPARIERLARGMGMHQPGPGQVRVVRPKARPRTAATTGSQRR